jgi:V/A-type H+-transporting ATPase subunit I
MALLDMKKVALIAHASSRAAVMKALQDIGAVEIISAKQEELGAASAPASLPELEQRLSGVRESLELIKKYDETKTGFLTPKPAMSRGELKKVRERFDEADQAIARMQRFSDEMNALKSRRQRLNSRIYQLEPFEKFDAPLESIGESRYTASLLGTIPSSGAEKYEQIVESYQDQAYFEMIDRARLAVYVAMPAEIHEKLTGELKYIGFTEAYTKDLFGTPKDLLYDFHSECETIDSEAAEHEEKAKNFVEDKLTLQAVEDYLINEIERERSTLKLGVTEAAFMLEGWLIASEQERAEKALLEAAPEAYITFSEPAQDDVPPTAVHNKKAVAPFEAVTNLYSAPSSKGVDPNFIMSIFYFFIFGMMIGDFAYGIILTAAAYLVLRLKKPTGMFRQITTVLMICGISTAFWGLVFGTIFSIENLPVGILKPLESAESAMTMLILCLGVGVVHLLFGLGMGAYANIRHGRILDAVLDNMSWMLVLGGAVMLVLGGIAGTVGTGMILLGVLMLLASQIVKKKNVFKALIGWLGQLYGATGYLSDILSYARIFAMGLATSVIAMVFNTIGELFFGSVVGYILAAIVMTVGHVFNIAINTLGAFVHTARLQYIEFYSKFYEAGGHVFAPLGIRTRNYRLEE